MPPPEKNFVFGPVPSRRLGKSLGVDLVPKKTCSFDCIYCQLGKTKTKTIERKEYAPAQQVIQQLKERLEKGPDPDVITFSGSGEPTLHSEIGKIIRAIKGMTDIPVAVLTNASLLSIPEVRDNLMPADIVIPNLDAGSAEVFETINKPHPGVLFQDVVSGLMSFAKNFKGELIIEAFIIGGINAQVKEVKKIAKIAGQVSARVHLNTVARPPAYESAAAVDEKQLQTLAQIFDPPAQIIGEFKSDDQSTQSSAQMNDVLEIIKRRPCTINDITAGLGIPRTEAMKYIKTLSSQKKITTSRQNNQTYYSIDQ